MKYFLNILFAAIISVSILPLYSQSNIGSEGYHGHDGHTQCHCNMLKISKDNGKVSYIIDCNSDNKNIISHTMQLRTAVLQDNIIHNNSFIKFSYLSTIAKRPERTLTTETPPPKAV